VTGLLCAALDRDRAEPVDDLTALRMGVRAGRDVLLMRGCGLLLVRRLG
jgi:CRISPR system Cascade subunit CasD